ncbi:MAG: hypothetical protein D6726_07040 [Nitrospirae bacterium]|nr:MAG: hypothetical protein D6726_07040 [Nitrospirota bacterium]
MGFWENLSKEIKKGIDEGLEALRDGTKIIKKRTETVTEDIKNKVKAFELRQKIQVDLSALGGRVYDLSSDKRKNPLRDEKVLKIIEKIRKTEEQIARLEGRVVKKKKTPSRKKKTTTVKQTKTKG